MLKVIVSILFSVLSFVTHAEIFYVTSNANAGLNTLRDALQKAAANGISQQDYIYFNLPGADEASVSIVLLYALPKITSNLEIDATSQPTTLLGNASIKVLISRSSIDYINCFELDGVSEVKIFGIYFSNFTSRQGVAADERTAAIFLKNVSKITIGAPGKGNGFGNNYTSVISPTSPNTVDQVNISSNIIGLNARGLAAAPNYVGIDLSYLSNGTIGGVNSSYGNIITGNENGASLAALSGVVSFSNNTLGLTTDNRLIQADEDTYGLFANGEFADLIISDNKILGQFVGIKLDNFKNKYELARNIVGNSPQSGSKKYGIHLYNCSAGNIRNDNVIAYNAIGIALERAYPVSILKNSIYCNGIAIQNLIQVQNQTTTLAPIAEITANGAKGSYLPNSKLELFYLDECSDCQGKTWLATVNTDGAGNWNYSGVVNGAITSMGTNQDGATSTFSKTTVSDAAKVIANERCGGSNGSIKGITGTNASVFQWFNSQNQLVGSQKDLENVTAGTYRLKVGQNSLCDKEIGPFTLTDVLADVNESGIQIVNANCDLANGSIKNITVSNNAAKTWYDSNGNIIAVSDDLLNVSAGVYYFKTGTGRCIYTSRNYTIQNLQPTFTVSSYQIFDANCEEDNGRIEINGYTPVRPASFYWLNENGNIVSTDENPTLLKEGIYRFYGKTTVGCEVLIGTYRVGRIMKVRLNLSNKSVVANCNLTRISLQNLTVSGGSTPYQYQWISEDGNPISSELNFKSIPIGKYKLIVTDANDCEIESELIDFAQDGLEPLKIPNTFTPNGDGINDVWNIKGLTQNEEVTVSVFSRAGQKIFNSVGYRLPFDGIYKGKVLPVGVYFYVINLGSSCDLLKGTLTIAR